MRHGTTVLTSAEHAVLDLATEDAYALWDVEWYLRRSLGLVDGHARDAAAGAVAALLRRGLVALLLDDGLGSPSEPLSSSAVDLRSAASWLRPPLGAPEIQVIATDEGARTFRAADRRRA